ncbi:hypothetical protein, partial [Parasutterella sp.]
MEPGTTVPFREKDRSVLGVWRINGHGRKGYHQTFVLPGNMLDKKYLRKWPSLAEGCLVKNISFLTETK